MSQLVFRQERKKSTWTFRCAGQDGISPAHVEKSKRLYSCACNANLSCCASSTRVVVAGIGKFEAKSETTGLVPECDGSATEPCPRRRRQTPSTVAKGQISIKGTSGTLAKLFSYRLRKTLQLCCGRFILSQKSVTLQQGTSLVETFKQKNQRFAGHFRSREEESGSADC